VNPRGPYSEDGLVERPTLDLLEELLMDFSGTLLVVSHDRAFLDNVVTSTFVFEGGGRVNEYVGGYTDWVRQRKPVPVAAPAKRAPVAPTPKPPPKRRKLSLKEAAELEGLPGRIDTLERQREATYLSLSDPAVLRAGALVAEARARLAAIEVEIDAAVGRWEELETIVSDANAQ